ncbi:MAG: response regulator [Candidatus Omnitrophica bacterium]|nr:response regulator [Candidatus Omnitrophota bacterium]
MKKILIVDDNEDLRSEMRDFLDEYETIEASTGEEALKILGRAHNIGLVILDVRMPGITGIDVLEELRKTEPELGVIILTGFSSKDVVIDALKSQANDYIEKPINIQKFHESVKKIMAKQNGEKNISDLDLSGKMAKIKEFLEINCFKKVCLEDAASIVNMSPKYLSRIFKESLGVGFNDYKLKIKIERAQELLTQYGYTVNQISSKLAYENTESFIRQFKRFCGTTPSSYRQSMSKTSKIKSKALGQRP